jgi:hypothetical protein
MEELEDDEALEQILEEEEEMMKEESEMIAIRTLSVRTLLAPKGVDSGAGAGAGVDPDEGEGVDDEGARGGEGDSNTKRTQRPHRRYRVQKSEHNAAKQIQKHWYSRAKKIEVCDVPTRLNQPTQNSLPTTTNQTTELNTEPLNETTTDTERVATLLGSVQEEEEPNDGIAQVLADTSSPQHKVRLHEQSPLITYMRLPIYSGGHIAETRLVEAAAAAPKAGGEGSTADGRREERKNTQVAARSLRLYSP